MIIDFIFAINMFWSFVKLRVNNVIAYRYEFLLFVTVYEIFFPISCVYFIEKIKTIPLEITRDSFYQVFNFNFQF